MNVCAGVCVNAASVLLSMHTSSLCASSHFIASARTIGFASRDGNSGPSFLIMPLRRKGTGFMTMFKVSKGEPTIEEKYVLRIATDFFNVPRSASA